MTARTQPSHPETSSPTISIEAMPIAIVTIQPMGSGPGLIRRPRAPTIRPPMMSPMISPMAALFPAPARPNVLPLGVGPEQRPLLDEAPMEAEDDGGAADGERESPGVGVGTQQHSRGETAQHRPGDAEQDRRPQRHRVAARDRQAREQAHDQAPDRRGDEE